MKIDIECGDIILFSRPCLNMNLIPAAICVGAKQAANTTYDHIGIVVEAPRSNNNITETFHKDDIIGNPNKGELYLLEANMRGVTCRKLKDVLERTSSVHYSIRKLIGPNTKSDTFKAQLWHEAEKVIGSSYNPSFSSMTNSLLSSYIAHGQDDFIQHTMKSRIERVESDVNATLNHLENSATIQKIIIKKLLNLRLDQLKMAKESVTITDKNKTNIDGNNADIKVKTYYCSQLVAEILTTAGVLSPYSGRADKVAYIPGDFSGSTLLPCVNLTSGYAYTPDLFVINKKIKGKAKYLNDNKEHLLDVIALQKKNGQEYMIDKTFEAKEMNLKFSEGDILPLKTLRDLIADDTPSSPSFFINGKGEFDILKNGVPVGILNLDHHFSGTFMTTNFPDDDTSAVHIRARSRKANLSITTQKGQIIDNTESLKKNWQVYRAKESSLSPQMLYELMTAINLNCSSASLPRFIPLHTRPSSLTSHLGPTGGFFVKKRDLMTTLRAAGSTKDDLKVVESLCCINSSEHNLSSDESRNCDNDLIDLKNLCSELGNDSSPPSSPRSSSQNPRLISPVPSLSSSLSSTFLFSSSPFSNDFSLATILCRGLSSAILTSKCDKDSNPYSFVTLYDTSINFRMQKKRLSTIVDKCVKNPLNDNCQIRSEYGTFVKKNMISTDCNISDPCNYQMTNCIGGLLYMFKTGLRTVL